jgi:hypothetical protein
MKIKKTVGMACIAGERKSYTIHTECGEEIECLATGSQGFVCSGTKYKSIKAIKDMIESNIDREEWQCDAPPDATFMWGDVEMNEQGNLWDCIDPCALLIRAGILTKHSMVTLNNHGWLNEDGTPDTDKADRAFKVFENNKVSFQDTEPSGE